MNLKYTIILLSLATPLAAETDCIQDKNETPYEIISCLNKRGIENAKAITKKAVEIKALTDLAKKQQNLIQTQQDNIKTLTEQLKKKLDVNDGWHGSFSFGSTNDGGRMYSTYEGASPFLNFIELDDPFIFRFKQTKDNDQVLISFDNGKVGIDTTPQDKLDVNGTIRGNNLHFLKCGDVHYNCTPRMCLDLCIKKGLRMATYDEVYAWASTGRDHCAFMWMLHSQHPNNVFRAYPMYNNRTSSGCGRLNTGNIPRMEGIQVFDWNSSQKYNCACAGIK